MKPRNGKMDEALFEKVIEDLSKMGFRGDVTYSFYNEPLLDKRLSRFINIAKSKLPMSPNVIFSNGDYLTQSVYDELDRAGIDSIFVTDHDNLADSEKRFSVFPKVKFKYGKSMNLSSRSGLVKVKKQVRNKLFSWLLRSIFKGCNLPTQPIVGYNGKVHLCCDDALKTTDLGDLTKESFADIMVRSGPLRKAILSGRFDLPLCRRCRSLQAQ
jgi:hypothetical protein